MIKKDYPKKGANTKGSTNKIITIEIDNINRINKSVVIRGATWRLKLPPIVIIINNTYYY